MISVFQTYFDKRSFEEMDPAFYPFNNEFADNDHFESHVMKMIYEMDAKLKQGIQYIGITSWKQKQKTGLSGEDIIRHINTQVAASMAKDVYIYSPPVSGLHINLNYSYEPPRVCGIISQPDIWHGHRHRSDQIDKDNHLLNNSGVLPFDLFDGKWQYCYYNYWISRIEVFNKYLETCLIPALKFYDLPSVKKQMPKWFTHTAGNKVTSAMFTLEGLFGAFLAHSNYSFDYIIKKKYRNKHQFIHIERYECDNSLLSFKSISQAKVVAEKISQINANIPYTIVRRNKEFMVEKLKNVRPFDATEAHYMNGKLMEISEKI